MNIAMHAYAPDTLGEILLGFGHSETAVELLLEDEGRPFDQGKAAPKPKAASLVDAKIGGLGIGLLQHYCKEISYRREDGRNQLTLHFPIGGI